MNSDALLISLLFDRTGHVPASANLDEFNAAVVEHRIGPILSDILQSAGVSEAQVPGEIRRHLDDLSQAAKAKHVLAVGHVKHICTALLDANIDYRVLKGWDYAYSLYRQPWYRIKFDLDIVVREESVDRVDKVFRDIGLETQFAGDRQVNYGQKTYFSTKTAARGLEPEVDLHWRGAGSDVIAETLDDQFFFQRESTLELDGLTIKVLPPDLKWLFSVVHAGKDLHYLKGSTASRSRLCDYYDLHLIQRQLTAREISLAGQQLDDNPPLKDLYRDVISRYCALHASDTAAELRAEVFNAKNHRGLTIFNSRLAYLRYLFSIHRSWREKLRLARELVFPSRQELQRKFSSPDDPSDISILVLIWRRLGRHFAAQGASTLPENQQGEDENALRHPQDDPKISTTNIGELNGESVLRASASVVKRDIDGESYVINSATDEHHRLDSIGSVFWDRLTESRNLAMACQLLAAEYETEVAALEQDVIQFSRLLIDKRLLCVAGASEEAEAR